MREERNPVLLGGVRVGGFKDWSTIDKKLKVATEVHGFSGDEQSTMCGGGGEVRVWRMHPAARYGYGGRDLSGLSWARAVRKKPLSNAVPDGNSRASDVEIGNGGAVKIGNKVLGTGGLETANVHWTDVKKEEVKEGDNEREEGEIVMDMEELLNHEAVEQWQEEDDVSDINGAMEMESKISTAHAFPSKLLDTYSSYQPKFGRYERLPSPTPSEDHDGKDNDCCSEASSSIASPNHHVNLSLLPKKSAVHSVNISIVQKLNSNADNATPASLCINPAMATSTRSRDPRIRYAGMDFNSLDLKEPPLIVGNHASTAVPAANMIGSKTKLSRSYEALNLHGPARKRQRTGPVNSVNEWGMDSNAVTGGSFGDNSTSETMYTRNSQIVSTVNTPKDPRTREACYSSGAVKKLGNETVRRINNLPTTLPSELLKNIAANPTMLLESLRRGGQQKIVQKPLPKYGSVVQLKPRDPRHVLFSGKLESATLPVDCSAEIKKNFDDQIQECQANVKPESSQVIAPDITRKNSENLRHVDGIVASSCLENSFSVASHIQSSSASMMDERKTNVCSVSEVEHLIYGYDDHQITEIQKERARRLGEQKKMLGERKLCLVLDLDHTLLNSAKFSDIDPVHEALLRQKEEQDRVKPHRHLFRIPHMGLWTKLRPGIWNFLEKASKLFELHVNTMGNKAYASEMAKILDPKGALFGGRVISRGDDGDVVDGDDKASRVKDLDGVLGMESSVIIIDDTRSVWPHNKPNLIAVERYIYFPCDRWQFGLPGPSLLDINHDERPEDGTLASILSVISRLHEIFFSHENLDDVDVRGILATEQRKILSGCRILFSAVIPVAEANPHLHPLWKLAEQFGASCTNQIDNQVTHVVANSPGTIKVKWAFTNGRFAVRPNWLEASALLYRRANEQSFAIRP